MASCSSSTTSSISGSNYYRIDLPTKPQAEIDLTGGIRPKLGAVTFDLGYIYYYYPGERRLFDPTFTTFFTPKNTDFLELAAQGVLGHHRRNGRSARVSSTPGIGSAAARPAPISTAP